MGSRQDMLKYPNSRRGMTLDGSIGRLSEGYWEMVHNTLHGEAKPKCTVAKETRACALRDIRKQYKLRNREIAELCGVQVHHVQSWAAPSQNVIMSDEMFVLLCSKLNIEGYNQCQHT